MPQEQASWVCRCEDRVVQRLEQDFKLTLQQQSSLDQWARWLDDVVTQALKQHAGSPRFPKAARQLLLKWSFYRWVSRAARQAGAPGPSAFGVPVPTRGPRPAGRSPGPGPRPCGPDVAVWPPASVACAPWQHPQSVS